MIITQYKKQFHCDVVSRNVEMYFMYVSPHIYYIVYNELYTLISYRTHVKKKIECESDTNNTTAKR